MARCCLSVAEIPSRLTGKNLLVAAALGKPQYRFHEIFCLVNRLLEGSKMSLNDLLSDEPFSYRATKSGLVQISFRGKIVTTLGGRDSSRFLAKVNLENPQAAQLAMAKATGHFKHGSERVGKEHKRDA